MEKRCMQAWSRHGSHVFKKSLSFSNMQGSRDLSCKSERGHVPHDITLKWNLKYDRELSYKTETRRTDLWLPKGGLGVWDQQMQTPVYKCINNKVPLYGTGNHTQNPVINHSGKDSENRTIYVTGCVCIHVWLSHTARQRWTQHWKSTLL